MPGSQSGAKGTQGAAGRAHPPRSPGHRSLLACEGRGLAGGAAHRPIETQKGEGGRVRSGTPPNRRGCIGEGAGLRDVTGGASPAGLPRRVRTPARPAGPGHRPPRGVPTPRGCPSATRGLPGGGAVLAGLGARTAPCAPASACTHPCPGFPWPPCPPAGARGGAGRQGYTPVSPQRAPSAAVQCRLQQAYGAGTRGCRCGRVWDRQSLRLSWGSPSQALPSETPPTPPGTCNVSALEGWSDSTGGKGWASSGACRIFSRLEIQAEAPACLSRISVLLLSDHGPWRMLLWAAWAYNSFYLSHTPAWTGQLKQNSQGS